MLGGVYLLMAMMLVLGSLMARREPFARALTMALAWIAIFLAWLLTKELKNRRWMSWQNLGLTALC